MVSHTIPGILLTVSDLMGHCPNAGSTQIPPCPGHFVCNNRVCVNATRVCDGALDCPQGEDELACGEGGLWG